MGCFAFFFTDGRLDRKAVGDALRLLLLVVCSCYSLFSSGGARNLRLGMPNIKKLKQKKIKVNIQYNERLSYIGHNKSIIITSGSLLRAGAGALALGRQGGCGLPLAELPLPRWGGREVGDELPDTGLGTGRGTRAESRGSEAHWGGHEARGTGASRKQRERERFFCILGFLVGLC